MLGYKETTPSRACWSSSVRGFFSLPSISPTQNRVYPINNRGAAEATRFCKRVYLAAQHPHITAQRQQERREVGVGLIRWPVAGDSVKGAAARSEALRSRP